jgi:hypothetical protein
MRPADLPLRGLQPGVRRPAIADQIAREVLAEQPLDHPTAPARRQREHGRQRGDDHPQPAALSRFPPARLVGMRVGGLLHGRLQGRDRAGQRRGGGLAQAVHAAHRQWGAQYVRAHAHYLAAAEPIAAREHRNRRLQPRPERPCGHRRRQDRAGRCPAGATVDVLQLMFGHHGPHGRQLRDLVPHRLAHRLARQRRRTLPAMRRPMYHDRVHLLRGDHRPLVRRMAGLPAPPPARRGRGRPGGRLGGIAGGRARGIGRVLPQAGFQGLHAGLQPRVLRPQGGQLRAHDLQQVQRFR